MVVVGCVCVCVCVCVCARARVRVCVHVYVCTFVSVFEHLNQMSSALISSHKKQRKKKGYKTISGRLPFVLTVIHMKVIHYFYEHHNTVDDSFSAPGFEDCTVGESACRAKGWFDTGSINGVAVCCPPGQGLYIDLSNRQHPCLC